MGARYTAPMSTAVIIVDHGSRRAESNRKLEEVVAAFAERTGRAIVEPAHMEFAKPTLADAFARCAERGATHVVVHPYFLLPGRHSAEDIPRMAAEAAAQHPHLTFVVTDALGLHEGLLECVEERVRAVEDQATER
jgi:sirohydrochlorin ferrochelatase